MLKQLLILSSFLFYISFLSAQNVGIGTDSPNEFLHLYTEGDSNTDMLLESEDSTGIYIIPGNNMPFLQAIYREGRFDQGILFYPTVTEFHTGWGKQFPFGGPYVAYPTLKMDDVGKVGVRMQTGDPTQALQVNGKLKIGDDAITPEAGVLRWDGNSFSGYDGMGWRSFMEMNDADNDTKISMHEGGTDSLIFQVNGIANQLIYDGKRISTTANNLYIGKDAGSNQTIGIGGNTAVGEQAAKQMVSGAYNSLYGISAGEALTSGSRNTMLGGASGSLVTNGSENVFIGYNAGNLNNGSGNVFIGYEAGRFETGSDQLYISNSNTSDPLIRGDFVTKEVNIFNDLSVNDDLTVNDEVLVNDELTARQVIVNDLNPQVKFNSGGATEYDITYDKGSDRLTISDQAYGAVLHIKDGDLYLPQYAPSHEKNLRIGTDGKISMGGNYSKRIASYTYDGLLYNNEFGDSVGTIGVDFEDGATITAMHAILINQSSSNFARVYLRRIPRYSFSPETIYEIDSGSTVYMNHTLLTDDTPESNHHIIDNDAYNYYLSISTYSDTDSSGYSYIYEVEFTIQE